MASDPSEEAISDFVNFTSTSRQQAVNFLKAHGCDPQRAVNAYFEDPTGPQIQGPSYQNHPDVPSFQIEHSDPIPPSTAPTRPPSTVNLNEQAQSDYQPPKPATPQNTPDPNKRMTLAEQEERELQQAVAMSLNQNLGQQETGVMSSNQNFNRATRDHYDEGEWAMTLFNSSAQEIIISPDPTDRKRAANEPAFLRPSQDGLHLGGLLTIFHSIPLAREALLYRNRLLSNYGHDSQWWNGQPISLPKIVSLQDAPDGDTDWDDIIYETQRVVAFLDSTTRAFGSVDALASLKSMSIYEPESSTSQFLESWQAAALRADPGNQLATVFSSTAHKRPLSMYDTPDEKDFLRLESYTEPDHDQTLYDVLDRTVWQDRPGEELDDTWLEHVAEVLTMKLESSDSDKPVSVKIPAVFYPDRYLSSCREIAREFRTRHLQVKEDLFNLETLTHRLSVTNSIVHRGMTTKETLEKAAAAATMFLPKSMAGQASPMTPEAAQADAQRLANDLRSVSEKVEHKLKELESRKQSALEALRGYTKTLTEPTSSSSEPPHHKYTLRGVCTEPHITYVLRPRTDTDDPTHEWQWWRISFSTEDAKARQAEMGQGCHGASRSADVIGYTARKVREIEVLRAAREESKNVLLVYANSNAVNFKGGPAPPQLQQFVDADNRAFAAEFSDQPVGTGESTAVATDDREDEKHHTSSAVPTAENIQKVNVFDYQVQSFEDDRSGQEMQERGRPLLSGSHPGDSKMGDSQTWESPNT
ncbi:uncharacterized protein BDW47DRAFT_133284 [Aspergillus candidus]|uniref:Ubiquitin interaction motif protein n=1 Tax=Aspergillus candidus TaxID=41067 RepID=A0A2I2F5A3_ASPCN|nr:ubiquitin interaction motif protein [Aspergillus candidus]PLB35793.1 ubiquitin interaction motif protein [Aspergillus candidus]